MESDAADGKPDKVLPVTVPRPVAPMARDRLDQFIAAYQAEGEGALTAGDLGVLDSAHAASMATIWVGSELMLGAVNGIQWLAAVASQPRGGGTIREHAAGARLNRNERWRARTDAVLSSPRPSTRYLPPNLVGIQEGWLASYVRVVEEGIPIYGIPRLEIAREILSSASVEARLLLLAKHRQTIVADCQEALDSMESDSLGDGIRLAAKAAAALGDGHPEAAQALAATVIDHLMVRAKELAREFTNENLAPGHESSEPVAYRDLPARTHLGFGPLWQAYALFNASKRDTVPRWFARHATVHSVDPAQFTVANAVQAVMLATSLLYRLAELEVQRLDVTGGASGVRRGTEAASEATVTEAGAPAP